MLINQGFKIDKIESFKIPTALENGITGWLQTFANAYFTVLCQDEIDD